MRQGPAHPRRQHHAGSTILKRTKKLKAVQGLLGHASINSSQRYAHVLIGDLREALEDEVQATVSRRGRISNRMGRPIRVYGNRM